MCVCLMCVHGVFVFVCVFINAGMPDCPASDQSSTGMIKTNDTGTYAVLDQADAVRNVLVRYRTEIMDARIPMPALVSLMPMPSYGEN